MWHYLEKISGYISRAKKEPVVVVKQLAPNLPWKIRYNYRGKGRSKYAIPPRLLQRFREFADSPQPASHKQEVALVETRLSELAERIDTGESGEPGSSRRVRGSDQAYTGFGRHAREALTEFVTGLGIG